MGKTMKKDPIQKKKQFKNIGFMFILLMIGLIASSSMGTKKPMAEVALSDVVKRANSGEIDTLTIKGSVIEVTKKGDKTARKKSSIYERLNL